MPIFLLFYFNFTCKIAFFLFFSHKYLTFFYFCDRLTARHWSFLRRFSTKSTLLAKFFTILHKFYIFIIFPKLRDPFVIVYGRDHSVKPAGPIIWIFYMEKVEERGEIKNPKKRLSEIFLKLPIQLPVSLLIT